MTAWKEFRVELVRRIAELRAEIAALKAEKARAGEIRKLRYEIEDLEALAAA